MRNVIIKIVLFVLCFFGGVWGMNIILGGDAGDYSTEMDQATLPLVYTNVKGNKINCMHGYTSEVDASLLHDSVTPMEGIRQVKLIINPNRYDVSGINYEIRSSDASSLVEEGELKDIEKDKHDNLIVTLDIRMQLKEGQYYILKLLLSGEGEADVTYYTRIVYNDIMHVQEQLDYVTDFSDVLLDKAEAERIKQYLESDPSKTSNDLGYVDITDSFEAITYADMKPQKLTNACPVITDISQDVASMKMSFTILAESSGGNTEYFEVVENYKVRYTSTRMYLLSYDRKMNSIYDNVFTSTSNNSLKLGVTEDSDIPYMISKDCKMAAFIKSRELFLYNYQHTQITRVFSFMQEDFSNQYDNYSQHNIKIISLADNGDMAFAVFGYMNRGRHEGGNGVLFYRYTLADNRIKEVAFIPSSQPFSALEEDMEQVVYMNSQDEIYISLMGELYCVNMQNNAVESLMSGVTNETVVSSKNHNLIAMLNGKEGQENKKITIRDLESQEEQTIFAEEGEVLRVIGFVEDDLVYGRVKEKDIVKRDFTTSFYPIYEVNIISYEGKLIKSYQPPSPKTYVMQAVVNNNLVELSLSKYNKDTFEDKGNDWIMSSDEDAANTVALEYTYNSVRYKELYMVFPNYIYLTAAPELLNTKETRVDNNRIVEVEGDSRGVLRYFVYEQGSVEDSYNDISTAIHEANERGGGVVNSHQKTVWEKSGIMDYATVGDDIAVINADDAKTSKEACVAMILAYEDEQKGLSELIKQNLPADELIEHNLNKTGVNLTGCTLDEVMYYICQGRPVIARNKEGRYILLTSFNSALIKYIDPVSGEVVRTDFAEMRDEFEQNGNVFYSYLK